MNPHQMFSPSSSSSTGLDRLTAMRSSRVRALARHPRSRRRGLAALYRSASNFAEQLEERRLLTQLAGGDTFEFVDANMQVIRVRVAGGPDVRVDLVGSTMQPAVLGSAEDLSDGVQDAQFPLLNDIPGEAANDNGTRRNIFGGVGGAFGITPLHTITGGPDSFTDILNGPRAPIIHPS